MIVPDHWAEGRVQHRVKGRTVTVKRFGWSDISQDDAQLKADERAAQALQRMLSGEKLPRRDPLRPYNGAEGVPIREEIVDRDGDSVITRNSYGARCLNTPNVMFVDIDFDTPAAPRLKAVMLAALLLGAAAAGWFSQSKTVGIAVALLVLWFNSSLAATWQRFTEPPPQDPEPKARQRVTDFMVDHPDWGLRVYRTPAGLRVLVTHRTFDPRSEEVAACFSALQADPVYAAMCRNQHCFRARVSAKPWRTGMRQRLHAKGVWPIRAERMDVRLDWIRHYEAAAASFAACRFVESLGNGDTDPDVQHVQALHDRLCRAGTQLPLA